MKKIQNLLSHMCIVLAVTIVVFIILDIYNPMMGFLSSTYSRTLLVALCITSVISGISNVVRFRRSYKEDAALNNDPDL